MTVTLEALQKKRKRIAPKVDPAILRVGVLKEKSSRERNVDGAVSPKTNRELEDAQREVKELKASLVELGTEIPEAQAAVERGAKIAELGPCRDEIVKRAMHTRKMFEAYTDERGALQPLLRDFSTRAKQLGFGMPGAFADGRMLQWETDATLWRSAPGIGKRPPLQTRDFRIGEFIMKSLDSAIHRANQNGGGDG